MSKKLTDIRLVAIELEVGRQAPAERTKTLQQLVPPRLARDTEFARIGDMNFDFVAFLKFKRLDNDSRKTNGQTIAPLRDLHVDPARYTCIKMYINAEENSITRSFTSLDNQDNESYGATIGA